MLFGSNNLEVYRSGGVNSGVSFNDNNWHIANTSWQSTGGNAEVWKDGQQNFTGTLNAGSSITAGGCLAIAGEQDAIDGTYDAGQAHFGDFTEIMVFNTFLNDAQHIIVSNYLSAKYNTTLAANDFYKQDDTANGDFDHNVAGIGQAADGSNHTDSQGTGVVMINTPSALSNGDYLFWGENAKHASYFFNATANNTMQLNATWRVSKKNNLGTVSVAISEADLSGMTACNAIRLIVSNTSNFSAKTTYDLNLSAGQYTATNVNFTDGDYFTLEFPIEGYKGPGGVGNCKNIPLWLRAEDISVADNTDISTWSDFSGNSNDVSQSNNSLKPIFKTNIANSYPVVRFNKSNNRLIKLNFNDFPSGEITAIYVNKNNGESSDGILSYASNAHNNDYLLYGSNNIRPHRRLSTPSTGVAANDNQWHVISTDWKSTGGDVSLWKDGSLDYTLSNFQSNTNITKNGCLAIAGEQDAVNGSYDSGQTHNGDFSEIIFYNYALNKAKHIIVSNYLSAKYGTLLAANDFYKQDDTANGNFDYNVAGIGQATDGSNHTDSQGTGVVRINTPSALSNGDYLFWGEETKNATYNFSTISATVSRLNSKWRVSKTNDLGTVTVSFDTPIDQTGLTCGSLKLVLSSASNFATKTVYDLTLSGGIYTATGVNFTDGDYFTIEYIKNSTTWNGSWDNGTPDITSYSVINSSYDMNSNPSITTCSCKLTAGNTITIPTGKFLKAYYQIDNDGIITVDHGGSIVQVDNTNNNTGTNYTIKKNTDQAIFSDVTYFSTPTVGTTIDDMVPATTYHYSFSPSAQNWNYGIPGTTVMEAGRGYILRNPTLGNYTVTFTGEIYNGLINYPVLVNGAGAAGDDDWNLLGNPYPSAIDADKFFATNSATIVGAVYYWKHATVLNAAHNDYVNGGYTVYNAAGAVGGTGGTVGQDDGSQFIPSGQSFFVEAKANGNVVFSNSDRDTGNNTTFYRAASNTNRVWLNLSKADNTATSQQLLAFYSEATDARDDKYDAHVLGSGLLFYSLLNNEKYSIRTNDSDYDNEMIPLGYQAAVAGTYTISIDHTTGTITNAGNYIYLKDNELNITHDLTASDYTFTTLQGENNNRFELFATQTALGVETINQATADGLLIAQNQDTYTLSTLSGQAIEAITVYDVLGRELLSVATNTFTLYRSKGQVFIIKAVLADGTQVSKKMIKS